MDDKDWLAFVAIAEEKNITKAAERLFVSQPGLSKRLKNLEQEFGAQLVMRAPNGVVLTPQGEYLLGYAKDMLVKLRKTKEYTENIKNKVQGTLRLGTSSIFAHYELSQILKGFLERYPDVDISLQTGLSQVVIRMLQKEEISVAILRGDYLWDEEKFLVHEEPICLVSAQPITFSELPNKPQISYMTDSSLKPIIDEWWRQSFAQPPLITMKVDNMDTCRQMVLNGLGWAFLPAIGLRQHDTLYIHELYWRNGEPLLRRTWMMHQNTSLELSQVKAFVDYIKEMYPFTKRSKSKNYR